MFRRIQTRRGGDRNFVGLSFGNLPLGHGTGDRGGVRGGRRIQFAKPVGVGALLFSQNTANIYSRVDHTSKPESAKVIGNLLGA